MLQRHTPFKFWQSVTGSLEMGESPSAAARRELCEETGLAVEGTLTDTNRGRTFVIDPRWRSRYESGVTENVEYEWHYRLPVVTDIQTDDDEHLEFRWVTIDEAIDTVWSWTNKEALRMLRTELHQK